MGIWNPDVLYKAGLILGKDARWHVNGENSCLSISKANYSVPVIREMVSGNPKISAMPGMSLVILVWSLVFFS
ncbi:hypothetical protein SRABI27_04087 [Pedobacter sp. Bi27]|uniref:hypothetical protein n=1 Tax=unclassified Pedobacter TaxID=2628915 RepID=UPI001D68AD23|nr:MULTISPECIES: hypothetical protein [unclassified Pedobacter]CAH0261476.1 hypothetical protein SRABI36_03479 [Pedobacter sp. Bi36]CAH0288252.1 hypothetical protein SRABI126_03973 [Pedobacter sp. Bi126]CAH0291687.1 hypothetical protein SRABI27_04087 [Pedobacter sp. Bi27]